MNILRANNFYKKNKLQYEVKNNKDLLKWLKLQMKKGYHPCIDLEGLQNMIDTISLWYEMKYPERDLALLEGIRYDGFDDMESLENEMSLTQLLYRLPQKELFLLECNYRCAGGGVRDIYDENGKVIGSKPIIFMRIKKKNSNFNPHVVDSETPDFLLFASADDGVVDVNEDLKEYINKEHIVLDELLNYFKEYYQKDLDFSKLEKCVFNHSCDLELREKVLEMIALKLLYSKRTTPERGYIRVKKFTQEFNLEFGINISESQINEGMNPDNSSESRRFRR